MAQTKRDRAGRDIPQTVTARTRALPEAEHPERSTGGSRGAVQPPNLCAVLCASRQIMCGLLIKCPQPIFAEGWALVVVKMHLGAHDVGRTLRPAESAPTCSHHRTPCP